MVITPAIKLLKQINLSKTDERWMAQQSQSGNILTNESRQSGRPAIPIV